MLALPIAFCKGGIILSLVMLCFFGIVGTMASLFICAAISRVPQIHPDTGAPTPRMEYCPLVAYYFRGKYHYLVQFLYNFSLQTKTISSIIISAQVMDKFCVWISGNARGLMVFPRVEFVSALPDEVIPFSHLGDHSLIVSTGYMISVMLLLPLGLLNLDENIAYQWISGIIMMAILGQFGNYFATSPAYPDQVPWVVGPSVMLALGVIMFCFTFIDTVPSWYNEKQRSLGASSTLALSVGVSTGIYVFLGVLGALAFPHISHGNVLEHIADGSSVFTQISVYVFSLSTIGLGIPIFCIIMRYNLYVGNVTSAWGSKFWGAIFPWLVSFFLYQGTGFIRFVNWTSLIFTNFTNFILPSYVYILALDEEDERGLRKSYYFASVEAKNFESGKFTVPDPSKPIDWKKVKKGAHREAPVLDLSSIDNLSDADSEYESTDGDPASPRVMPKANERFSLRTSVTSCNGGATNGDDGVQSSEAVDDDDTEDDDDDASLSLTSIEEDAARKLLANPKLLQSGKGIRPNWSSADEPKYPEDIIYPVPMWLHKRYPRLVPWATIVIMSLLSIVALGVDLYYLIVYGIDLTDI